MKKSLTFFLFAGSLFLLNSCNKLETESTSLVSMATDDLVFSVSNDNGILNFDTKEDYEMALNYLAELEQKNELDKFDKKLAFKSYRLAFKENKSKMEAIQDDILATFLSPENKVIIGGRLFEINLQEDRVSVWEYNDCDLKSVSKNLLIGEFKCDDDVFSILEGESNFKSTTATTCPANSVERENQGYAVNNGVDNVTYHYRIFYIKGGIYYTLNSRISQDYTKTNIGLNSTYCEYLRINDDEVTKVGTNTESGYNWERSYRPYWGLKRLDSYNFTVTFSAKDNNGVQVFSNELNDTCLK